MLLCRFVPFCVGTCHAIAEPRLPATPPAAPCLSAARARHATPAGAARLVRAQRYTRSAQKATALAAATFRESTPCCMGMRTV